MPVLYVIGCAAPPVLDIKTLIELSTGRGWDTCLILTPTADRWLADQRADLAELTGHPVRSAYKLPGQPDVHPPADAMVVAPATSNTLNKWAAGISDTLALGLIVEAIGRRLPLAALPWVNIALSGHPAFSAGVALLRSAGVRVIGGDERGFQPADAAGLPDWTSALDRL
jgi:hypothetical protein